MFCQNYEDDTDERDSIYNARGAATSSHVAAAGVVVGMRRYGVPHLPKPFNATDPQSRTIHNVDSAFDGLLRQPTVRREKGREESWIIF
ncbi:unnamed protein product [Arctogadus glacialis]